MGFFLLILSTVIALSLSCAVLIEANNEREYQLNDEQEEEGSDGESNAQERGQPLAPITTAVGNQSNQAAAAPIVACECAWCERGFRRFCSFVRSPYIIMPLVVVGDLTSV